MRIDENLVRRIAALSDTGWIGTTVLQDVHVPAGVRRTHELLLHGDVQRTHCLECGAYGDWPPAMVWRHCDVRCASCQGPLVPDITLFGSTLAETAALRLREICERCAVVLVLGVEMTEPATVAFLDGARRAGATVIFMSEGTSLYPRRANDLTIAGSVERCLAWLRVVLPIGWMLRRHRIEVVGPRVDRVPRAPREAAE